MRTDEHSVLLIVLPRSRGVCAPTYSQSPASFNGLAIRTPPPPRTADGVRIHEENMKRTVTENPPEKEWLELRKKDLTSTDVAALFGANKYKSLYQIWSEKRTGISEPFKDNDRMKWGRRLEQAVADGLCEDAGMACKPYKHYVRLDEHRLGSSFDCLTSDGALLEIKTVDPYVFKKEWFKMPDGGYIAPDHIELQVQHQMLVSGIDKAYIGALVGGNRSIPLQYREMDYKIHSQILARAADFWKTVDEESAPVIDFDNELDVKAVIAGQSHAEPGKEMQDGTDEMNNLASRHLDIGSEIRELTKEQKSIKAQILDRIGDSERVLGGTWTINAGLQGPVEVDSYTRKGFRTFKITKRKGS